MRSLNPSDIDHVKWRVWLHLALSGTNPPDFDNRFAWLDWIALNSFNECGGGHPESCAECDQTVPFIAHF